jgi:hypothetical protein
MTLTDELRRNTIDVIDRYRDAYASEFSRTRYDHFGDADQTAGTVEQGTAHRSFEGKEGTMFADAMLGLAHQELVGLREVVGGMGTDEAKKLQARLAHQEQALENAASADELRFITEEGRHIRQEISRLKSLPENRGKVMEVAIAELVGHYGEVGREFADPASNRRF